MNQSENDKTETGLHEWLDIWLKVYVRPKVREETHRCYECAVKLAKKWISDQSICQIAETQIQSVLITLAEMGYSKSTIRILRLSLQQAFRVAIRNKIISGNPVEYTYIPEFALAKDVQPLTLEQQKRLEKACLSDIHGDLFLFLLNTGLRRDELCNLRWKDYNATKSTIQIRKSKTRAGLREIPLLPICTQIIALQPKRNEFIFSSRRGGPITESILHKTYLRLRKTAEIPNLTNHVCRHTFATRLVEAGADPKAVAALLGHTDVAFTLNRYVHAQPEHLRQQVYLLQTDSLISRAV